MKKSAQISTEGALKDIADIVTIGAKKLAVFAGRLAGAGRSRSLTDLSKSAQVRPIVIIDSGLRNEPIMTSVMQSVLSIFIGYYLQAIALSTKVGNIRVTKFLNAFNPEASISAPTDNSNIWSVESYADGLPNVNVSNVERLNTERMWAEITDEEQTALEEHYQVYSLEDDSDQDYYDDAKPFEGSIGSNGVKSFNDVSKSMAVGKMIEVDIVDDKEKITVPVVVRAVPSFVTPDVLTHIFASLSAKKNQFRERYYLWKAGQIRFVQDLILNFDRIDEHRRNLVKDQSNAYATVHNRGSRNLLSRVALGEGTMAEHSNILVVSSDTMKGIERTIGGKVSSVMTRTRLFNDNYLILLVILDTNRERATIYHRGLIEPSEFSFRDLKSADKKDSGDILEILKAYQLGATPTSL